MKSSLGIILGLLTSSQLFAAPSTSMNYLMNDSVSMFEWGLYKIENTLIQREFDDLDLIFRNIGRAEYDWDANRINISMAIYPSNKQITKIGAKKACKIGIIDLKESFGSAMEAEYRRIFGINTYFEHKGFVNKSQPKTLEQDLENITKFTIQIYSSENDQPIFSNKATCTSMLLEKDIYFKEK